jgi:hypothetical protein
MRSFPSIRAVAHLNIQAADCQDTGTAAGFVGCSMQCENGKAAELRFSFAQEQRIGPVPGFCP